MNYLGIDYGEKKIGLSKASSELPIAVPFKVISSEHAVAQIKDIVASESIDELVIGYPLKLSGEQGAQAKIVDDFIKRLSALGKPIHKQDERFSTRAAVSASQDDASAAALILQMYLDKRSQIISN